MSKKHVGFTGTRNPLTEAQRASLKSVIESLENRGFGFLHHGDCVGADETAHGIAVGCGIDPILHPPDVNTLRAWCKAGTSRPPLPYLDRNREIVNESEALIACPDGPERLRSGTWSTVRYARQLRRRILIIYPDGRVVPEKGSPST